MGYTWKISMHSLLFLWDFNNIVLPTDAWDSVYYSPIVKKDYLVNDVQSDPVNACFINRIFSISKCRSLWTFFFVFMNNPNTSTSYWFSPGNQSVEINGVCLYIKRRVEIRIFIFGCLEFLRAGLMRLKPYFFLYDKTIKHRTPDTVVGYMQDNVPKDVTSTLAKLARGDKSFDTSYA